MFDIPLPLLIVPLGLFILIVYFAVSKKSSLFIRWTAIIALILIGIAVLVCVLVISGEPTEVVVRGKDIPLVSEEKPVPVQKTDPLPLLIFSILLLLFIAFMVYAVMREQKKNKTKGGGKKP